MSNNETKKLNLFSASDSSATSMLKESIIKLFFQAKYNGFSDSQIIAIIQDVYKDFNYTSKS